MCSMVQPGSGSPGCSRRNLSALVACGTAVSYCRRDAAMLTFRVTPHSRQCKRPWPPPISAAPAKCSAGGVVAARFSAASFSCCCSQATSAACRLPPRWVARSLGPFPHKAAGQGRGCTHSPVLLAQEVGSRLGSCARPRAGAANLAAIVPHCVQLLLRQAQSRRGRQGGGNIISIHRRATRPAQRGLRAAACLLRRLQ